MTSFTFKKSKDLYVVTNLESVAIHYEVKKQAYDKSLITVQEGFLQPSSTKNFKLIGDGEYNIVLTVPLDSLEERSLFIPPGNIYIKHYNTMLLSIIGSITEDICDCNCGCDCGESKEAFCNLLMLRAKMDVFRRLTNPEGVVFYDTVNKKTQTLVEKSTYCAVDKELLHGVVDCDEKLIKQLIVLDYLGRYFFELAQAQTQEDKLYIEKKFITKTIFCCIENLGVEIQEIKDLILNNNMGTFTINSGSYVNQPPTVGNKTITVLNRAVTPLTLDMFTTTTTPAYSDPEGDAAKSVRIDSLPVDGILTLNGVAVTAGQVILVADILSNNLVYTSPNQNALDNDVFAFSVSDEGSGLFGT
jgi:hypothetical protein